MLKKFAKWILREELTVMSKQIISLTLENKGYLEFMEAQNGKAD